MATIPEIEFSAIRAQYLKGQSPSAEFQPAGRRVRQIVYFVPYSRRRIPRICKADDLRNTQKVQIRKVIRYQVHTRKSVPYWDVRMLVESPAA